MPYGIGQGSGKGYARYKSKRMDDVMCGLVILGDCASLAALLASGCWMLDALLIFKTSFGYVGMGWTPVSV